MGIPDLYAYHIKHGSRWIEIKRPNMSVTFTNAQLIKFPEFASKGIGIWVLTAATDEEYFKLFKPANWHTYLPIYRKS
jgi:hypothetical protein